MLLKLRRGKLERATAKSAGYDLFSAEPDRVLIPAGERLLVKTGVVATFDRGHVAMICDKSGHALKLGLTVLAGIVDPDYDEEWGVVLLNTGKEPVIVRPGKPIAQVLFLMLGQVSAEVSAGAEFVENDLIRQGGFGSTG